MKPYQPCPSPTVFPNYIWGYSNILGCLFGSIALWLHFCGIVVDKWPWLAVTFYGLGWIIGRRAFTEQTIVDFGKKSDSASLLNSLDQLIETVESRLPMEAVSLLCNIQQNLAELLPRMADYTLYSEDIYIVEATIRRYIPATLASYLRLPTAYARSHVLIDGKTASTLLVEQLSLLDDHVHKLLKNVLEKDTTGFLENGRFLANRFKPNDFFKLGDAP